jgi:hypothetical protein
MKNLNKPMNYIQFFSLYISYNYYYLIFTIHNERTNTMEMEQRIEL